MFTNLSEASWSLLGEATQGAALPFVVIGGWSPLILNSTPVRHPGTRDVDLLFSGGRQVGALAGVLRAFISAGYVPSAKHPFQALRLLDVGGERLAFNVDLLHPYERAKSCDMFVDHLDLDLWLDAQRLGKLLMKSVVTPVSQFIFDGHIQPIERELQLPDGRTETVSIPLMDELGTLVTKAKSVASAKRHRDALDIYLAIAQARSRSKLITDVRDLSMEYPEAYAALEILCQQVNDLRGGFWRNFARSIDEWNINLTSADPAILMRAFFDDAGVMVATGV